MGISKRSKIFLHSTQNIELYYADGSHVCTDGYVPYGWQFKDENVYIASYSPELNLAETLCSILEGKWIRPSNYNTKDSLFYCANRTLASVGTNLFVNYSFI